MTGDGVDDAAMARLLATLAALGGESAERLRQRAAGSDASEPDAPPAPAVDAADALRGVGPQERALLGEGLRVIAEWVRRPGEDTGRQVDAVIARLRRDLGPLIAHGHDADEAAEQDRLRADVRATIALRLREARTADPSAE
ncbi:hypothetical protein [Streptomyces shenzhenensis]|uniref:hypothetical protein n=1 Tax=Streptomyces shenzhenensis TaxID=943815 RepID=UPI0036CA216B